MKFVAFVLFCHWIGDFVLQTNYISNSNGYSIKSTLKHTLIYFIAISFIPFTLEVNSYNIWCWVILNTLLHLIIDYSFTKRLLHFWEKDLQEQYLLILSIDQLLHLICIFGTYLLFLRFNLL